MVEEAKRLDSGEAAGKDAREKYRALTLRRAAFLTSSILLLVVAVGISISVGSASITFFDAYATIIERFFPGLFEINPLAETVVWNLRLPRILLAIMAGATLAMAGSTTQSVLRNPLATPYTLGISTAAGFGAAIGIILGRGIIGEQMIIVGNSFVFSLIPLTVILFMVRYRGTSPETMILTGVAMLYIFSAMTTILQYFAEANALAAVVFWNIGDLSRAAWWQLSYILPVFVVCFLINLKLSWDLNLIKMGDETAKSLGVEVGRIRNMSMVVACLSTATVVSFTGAIGFIGLVSPHICRLAIGSDDRYLLVSSTVVGAILLLVSDIIARRLLAPMILPVGAITSFLGGPLLLYLLIRKRTIR